MYDGQLGVSYPSDEQNPSGEATDDLKRIPEMVNHMLIPLILTLILFGGIFFNASIAAASDQSKFSDCISWCDRTYGATFGQECCIKGCAKAF